MNRNSSSHFSATDNRINIGRSKFNRDSWYKTTMNFGDLVPFYVDEILPGDSFDMKTSVLCRMSTPKVPVADNSYLDTYFSLSLRAWYGIHGLLLMVNPIPMLGMKLLNIKFLLCRSVMQANSLLPIISVYLCLTLRPLAMILLFYRFLVCLSGLIS